MTRRWLLLGLLACAPGQLEAQRPHRSGLWIELGAGPTATRVSCTRCTEVTRGSGPVGYTRIGGSLSGGVLFGLESSTQVDEAFGVESGAEEALSENTAINAILLWFPSRTGFFFKAGVGYARGRLTVEPEAESPVVAEGNGVGMTFGVGWDLPITRHVSISLNAASWITAIGDLVLPEVTVDDVIASRWGGTIGLTIR
ncbi:MAG: hypothetical protein MJB57_09015 [Gemmatimonadetes bacterium]|nr:hypothetical protein [Gemmatimonadota bacterium]